MFKKLLVIITCLTLAGCSVFKTQPTSPEAPISWEQHQALLKNYASWELSGKVGIRTSQDSQSANLKWLQAQQSYQIDIHGPWGQGGASITGQPGNVTVQTDGKEFKGENPEQILRNQLGWDLPISDIYWWIRGLPSPRMNFSQTLENNRLKTLHQDGWDINYLRYNSLTPVLPSKLTLSRQDLRITVVINSWIKR